MTATIVLRIGFKRKTKTSTNVQMTPIFATLDHCCGAANIARPRPSDRAPDRTFDRAFDRAFDRTPDLASARAPGGARARRARSTNNRPIARRFP